jgi:hypothetical protein
MGRKPKYLTAEAKDTAKRERKNRYAQSEKYVTVYPFFSMTNIKNGIVGERLLDLDRTKLHMKNASPESKSLICIPVE